MDNVSFFVHPLVPSTTDHPSAGPLAGLRDSSRAGSLPAPHPSLPPRPASALSGAPNVTPVATGLGATAEPEPLEAWPAMTPMQGSLHCTSGASAGCGQAGRQPFSPSQLSSSPLALDASDDPAAASQPGLTETPEPMSGDGLALVARGSAEPGEGDMEVPQPEYASHGSASTTNKDDLVLAGIYGHLDTWKSGDSWFWKFQPQPARLPSMASAHSDQISRFRSMPSARATSRRGRRRRYRPGEDAKIQRLREVERLTWEQISDQMPGRTPGAVMVRYHQKIKSKASREPQTHLHSTTNCEDSEAVCEVRAIVQHREVGDELEFLVEWSDETRTWEPLDIVNELLALDVYEGDHGEVTRDFLARKAGQLPGPM